VTAESDSAQQEARVSSDLVARIGRGDPEAEAEMCRRYGQGLVYLLSRRTGDKSRAEDICQDALATGIEKLRSSGINKPESLAAFLRGIAINLLTGEYRKAARRATVADTETIQQAIAPDPGPFEDISSEQAQRAVRKLLNEITVTRDRDVLISVYLRDEDRESICQRLDVDATHFNRVLSRAKKRFRELVERAEREGRIKLVGEV
jgi:RNA polymerase sigma-70 factor (ECF subfamily)